MMAISLKYLVGTTDLKGLRIGLVLIKEKILDYMALKEGEKYEYFPIEYVDPFLIPLLRRTMYLQEL